mgnify:CR=1 FL=1
MATEQKMAEGVAEFVKAVIAEGKRLAEEDERRLGRRLTATEAGEIADMVIRQAGLAVAIKKAGG